MGYNFLEIEKKWQDYWAKNQTFKAENKSTLPKYYVLDMFPYPSGAGLHVGHPLGYIASDIYARYKRHKGFNVLHPQGYDSFGLPAEQYAIQTGQHPNITTQTNINRYREQLDRMGFSFDWSREIRTSQADYYKWTQWIFLLLFDSYYCKKANAAQPIKDLISQLEQKGNQDLNAVCDENSTTFTATDWSSFSVNKQQEILLMYRLAYLSETEVNWCPELGTVLANDEIINGVSERGGFPVTKKKMKQWSMRIGAYAERLLQGLNTIDWPGSLKEMQRNWIGKSIGANVRFEIQNHEGTIEVFTTRPDTLFGVTFMTLAPEHDLVEVITTAEQKEAVAAYVEASAQRSERDRMSDVKTISGVFTGAFALHPLTQEPVPIWIGDYVLAGYGTGAVMAVPCGDQRDYDFAKHFNIPIRNIFEGADISKEAFTEKGKTQITDSDFLNGLAYKEAMASVIERLEKDGSGEGTINYRLRDAIFSRQRYWGEPIPVYYKEGLPVCLKPENLPLILPEVEQYLPTPEGAPPLGNATIWAWDAANEKVVPNTEINDTTVFPLELNTMPGWAGSSWYFNRYMDADNTEAFVSKEAVDYWQEVDLYLGGSEHATGHLLYSRFWQKFLFDLNLLPVDEYAKKLINQGMILGSSAFVYRKKGTQEYITKSRVEGFEVEAIRVDISLVNSSDELDMEGLKNWQSQFKEATFVLEDGVYVVGREVEKMSKSKYNVVNPDQICEQYGADTLRMYEMFLGPLEQAKPWNTAGISGVYSFLKKLWRLYHPNETFSVSDKKASKESLKSLHQTIKKVTEDIENFSFNTCISSFMICINELTVQKCNERDVLEPLSILLAPFASHTAEELWELLGYDSSISTVAFPIHEPSYLIESSKNYPVSFNGKMRFTIELSLELKPKEIEEIIMNDDRTQQQLQGRTPKKVIVVPGKIINIVG
ncbi:leucine--tRNA ligase [Flavobacteriaceae bacterium]|nr:leucine--tRNA ligase [Flavobacteriaceae bacterium]